MTIEIRTECAMCGQDLIHNDSGMTRWGDITLTILPCPSCIKDAVEELKGEEDG